MEPSKNTQLTSILRTRSRVVHKSSLVTCWTALAKTIIGVGLLALPMALQRCGWVIGFILFFFAFSLALLSLHLLNILAMNMMIRLENIDDGEDDNLVPNKSTVRFRDKDPLVQENIPMVEKATNNGEMRAPIAQQRLSYYAIANHCAPSLSIVLDIAIPINCIGVAIGYIQVAGDAIVALVEISNPTIKADYPHFRSLVCLGCTLLVSPFSYLRKISNTKYINIGGLFCITFLVICAAVLFENRGDATTISPPGDGDGVNMFINVVSQWPLFIFAFTCHQNLLILAEDLEMPSVRRLDIVAYGAQLAALVLFLPAMVLPYITYGSEIQDKFLNNFPADSPLATTGRVCVIVAELCALALQVFPARKSITILLEMFMLRSGRHISEGRTSDVIHYSVTTVILLIIIAVSMATNNLHTTFTIVGLFASNTMANTMPALLYIMTFKYSDNPILWAVALFFLVFTTLMVPVSLTAILMDIFS